MSHLNMVDNRGVIEKIKESLHPESVADRFGVDKNLLVDVGVYGAIGFIAGFLLKKYSEYFFAFVVLCIGLIVLQQFDYLSLSVNSARIQSVLGLEEMPIAGVSFSSLLWEWMRTHVVSSSSLVIGFLIGLKVG